MKVTIGPYTSWFGPYQLAELLCFWVKEVEDEYGMKSKPDWVHKFGEWLAHGSIEPPAKVGEVRKWGEDRHYTWLYKFLLWVESKKQRKIKVRIDPWDTWSMDHTLAHIILPMLKQLNASKHGAPSVDDEDVPDELKSTSAPPKQNEYDTDDNWHKRWDWVMGEMIFAFEKQLDDSWEEEFETGENDIQWQQLENGISQLIEGPNHTKVYDWESRKKVDARIQNGFRLFGKYYQGLWD